MTRQIAPGAVPIARLAELESEQNHIRERAADQLRAQAERNRELTVSLERLETATDAAIGRLETKTDAALASLEEATKNNGEAIAGILGSVSTVKWLLAAALGLMPVCLGAAWALGRLIH